MINEMKQVMETVLKGNGLDVTKDNLKFGKGNSKFDNIQTFSIPAGHSCPYAKDCRSCATVKPRSENTAKDKKKGVGCGFGIQDGPHTQFRCFAAIDEIMRPSVRLARWWNYLILLGKSKSELVNVIQRSIQS